MASTQHDPMAGSPRRILIVSASVGGGHVRAAQAVEIAMRRLAPDAEIRNVDVLAYSSPIFRRIYSKTYFDLVANAPHLLGYMYDLLDRPRPPARDPGPLRSALQRLNLAPFLSLLDSRPWDLAVNTHFLPAELIGARRRRAKSTLRQMTVVTDFDPHRLWITPQVDCFVVATDEAAAGLVAAGVDHGRVRAHGIPVHPAFAEPLDRTEARTSLQASDPRPLVLLLASGLKPRIAQTILHSLLAIESPLHIVAITGRSPRTQHHLAAVRPPTHHAVQVLGFTDQMNHWLAAADLVVTKPGGLTSAECLVRACPMVVVDPIPGQEAHNSDYLLENGAAVRANNLAVLGHKVNSLLANPERLTRMRESCRAIARPNAAMRIAEAALELSR